MIQKIGYPDTWRDYSSVKIVPDDFLANAVAANAFEVRRQLNKINQPVDKMEWGMTPPTINAYNDPQNNTINFPAGILQFPFFNAAQGDAENYGGIGMVIGHEIIHGFDDQGRKFDAKGNLRDWWTPADAKAYDERGNCLSAQYTHDVPELGAGVKTNGKLTQGEDTADNGGLHLAVMALRTSTRPAARASTMWATTVSPPASASSPPMPSAGASRRVQTPSASDHHQPALAGPLPRQHSRRQRAQL